MTPVPQKREPISTRHDFWHTFSASKHFPRADSGDLGTKEPQAAMGTSPLKTLYDEAQAYVCTSPRLLGLDAERGPQGSLGLDVYPVSNMLYYPPGSYSQT